MCEYEEYDELCDELCDEVYDEVSLAGATLHFLHLPSCGALSWVESGEEVGHLDEFLLDETYSGGWRLEVGGWRLEVEMKSSTSSIFYYRVHVTYIFLYCMLQLRFEHCL